MSGVTFQLLLAGGPHAFEMDVEYTLTGASPGSSTINTGTPDPSRVLIFASAFQAGSAVPSPTIDGNAMTLQVQKAVSGTNVVSIWSLAWPTGTTATLGGQGTGSGFAQAVYAMYGASSATPAHTASSSSQSSTIDVPAGGGMVAAGYTNNGLSGFTWTGVTADATNLPAVGGSIAHETTVAAQTGHSFSFSSAGGLFALVGASWGP